MSNIDEQELEKLMERIVNQFMGDQIANLKEYKKEDNNSFVFLEKGTLNLLIAYMLTGTKRYKIEAGNEEIDIAVVEDLNQIIEDSKQEFEDIIHLLKNLS
ncbi:MAG: hypothetical protein RR595_05175 [Lysinibacillus sp.]